MPFQKGNTLWKGGLVTKDENRSKLDQFFGILSDGGVRVYGEKLEELANGVELSKPELKYMEKVEGLLPYVRGKRGNVDEKGDTIPTNINILNTTTDELLKIATATGNG